MTERFSKFLRQHGLLLVIILVSLPIKFATALNMPWDIDVVPVVARNVEYGLPPVGTLSSVAAYNMPMLEWLHLPAQWLTGNVWWTIVLTMLVFNILSTISVYTLGWSMFDQRVGLVSVLLFTFSEVGISSSYTAWAQLLLPGFFVMVVLCLWLWLQRENGFWLAFAGVIATAAFMTHFSALLLYPAMLVFALATRAKWQLRWLVVGAITVLLMMTPYLLVQVERDFADMKAFLTQEPLVPDTVFTQYEIYKPGYYAPSNPEVLEQSQPTVTPDTEISDVATVSSASVRPRWLRAIDYALQTPKWYWRAMTTGFTIQTRAISSAFPVLAPVTRTFLSVQHVMLVISISVSAYVYLRDFRQEKSLTATPSARLLLLVGFNTVIIALMILTRTIINVSYWMGLMGLEYLIAGYAVSLLPNTRRIQIVIFVMLLLFVGIQVTERSMRLIQHDDTQFSAYNVSIYRHVEATVDYIADDWEGNDTIKVSYDILQDVRHLWWVPAWNSIDPSYTLGMNFDFLLAYHHDLHNLNDDPIGTTDDADYIVLYTPSLENYNLTQYDLAQFGTIVVLKRRQE